METVLEMECGELHARLILNVLPGHDFYARRHGLADVGGALVRHSKADFNFIRRAARSGSDGTTASQPCAGVFG